MMISEKLDALRAAMKSHQLDFYFVPSTDPHQSEYVPECWERRSFISGFTGSAGDVLVGLDQAYLWTDGRYFLQAENELDLNLYQIMKQTQGMAAPIHVWLGDHAAGKRVGVDPRVLTVTQAKRFKAALESVGGELVFLEDNLVDSIRTLPAHQSVQTIHLWPENFSGQTAANKLTQLQNVLKDQGHSAMLVNALDAIAWVFNVRGQDVEMNPLVISYAVITQTGAHWFVDQRKLLGEHLLYLKAEGVTVHDYESFKDFVEALDGSVCLDPNVASAWMHSCVKADIKEERLPIDLLKACKNPVEQNGMRQAHVVDGVSLTRFIMWLETNWKGLDEHTAAEKLYEMRALHPDFRGSSFATISGYGSNGAVIHYRAHPDTALPLANDNLYLLDSGAQYWQGTTDVTRVMHFGEPTAEQKRHYTLVLKGHLALQRARFVQGTAGAQLDALARQFLWADNLDYMHGTGHGVGCYLCVHEGPQRISPGLINQPLLPGMVVSNEPGVYLPGKHGIRIENLCLINEVASGDQYNIGVGPFLGFEDLTLVPYNWKLIDSGLLTEEEKAQITAYHQRVWDALSPHFDAKEKDWLTQAL